MKISLKRYKEEEMNTCDIVRFSGTLSFLSIYRVTLYTDVLNMDGAESNMIQLATKKGIKIYPKYWIEKMIISINDCQYFCFLQNKKTNLGLINNCISIIFAEYVNNAIWPF